MNTIGILGGTFNPIHFGHLRMAQELTDALQFDELRLIPAANPPHKTLPTISAQHRANMVALAIEDHPNFILDTREMAREGDSYTIDTLKNLREEFGGGVSLCLCMGTDAFIHLESWHTWQALIEHCHIVLVKRPNSNISNGLSTTLSHFLQRHYTENFPDLHQQAAGFITMQSITALDISSTMIRNCLKNKQSARYLLPENVRHYIEIHHLYDA